MNVKPTKAIFIGCDGMMPDLVEKFMDEGDLPVLTRLMDRGIFTELLSSPTVDTPTNWTSLATGAWTGTHGINGFARHVPGEPYDRAYSFRRNIMPAFADIGEPLPEPNRWYKHLSEVIETPLNQLCQAEYLWQAAERADRRSILVNYPGGWPPNIKEGIVVDGAGPYCSKLSRLGPSAVFATSKQVAEELLQIRVVPATGWEGLPVSTIPPLEAVIDIAGERSHFGETEGSSDANAINPIYYLLLTASNHSGYDQIIVAGSKTANEPMAVLKSGATSNWLHDVFATKFGQIPAKFKLKLLELSADGQVVRLQRSAIYNTKGWAYPQSIADELIDYVESLDLQEAQEVTPYIIPLCSIYESIEDQAISLALTCRYLQDHEPWDLLFVQIHSPDGVHHRVLSEVCPEWDLFDPSRAEESWAQLRQEYRILDRMIGDIVESCADEETVVVVASDHGALPTFKRVWLGKALMDAGLVVYEEDEATGQLVVDWSRTKAVLLENPFGKNVWVNLKGRDPQGIVEPGEEYERVRTEIISTLGEIADEETGMPVVAAVMRKEEARFLGQWGDAVGDIVFYLTPGYATDFEVYSIGPIDPDQIPDSGFTTVPRDGILAVHGQYLPTARYGGFSDSGILLMTGPGVRAGYRPPRDKSVSWTIDLAPTLAHLLGIPAPAQAEGKVLNQFLVS